MTSAARRRGLRLQSVIVSFQRFPLVAFRPYVERQRSFGALPIAQVGPDRYVVPVAPEEAIWLGVLPVSGTTAISFGLGSQAGIERDVLGGGSWDDDRPKHLIVPPVRMIYGIRRSDGAYDAIHRAGPMGDAVVLKAVAVRIAGEGRSDRAAAVVELTDPRSYAERSGHPPPEPLDPDASYKGHLLP